MKKYMVIVFVIGMIMLTGCQNGEKPSTKSTSAFIGGTDSIEFDFLEGAPPVEVYDGGEFPFEVSLIVENKGEYDVTKEDVTITLQGFYPPDFSSPDIEKNPDDDLDGSYIDSGGNEIPGTVSYVTFNGFNFAEDLKANNEYTIRADVCYKYGSRAQVDLCILEDLTETEDKVCDPNEKKTVDSSSAPIKIENFQEDIAGSEKVTFSFEIQHRGTGAISRKDSDCDDEVLNENKVYVEIDTGLSGLTCSGLEDGADTSGYVTLYSGKRLIRCTQDKSGLNGDFNKKVNINLEYDYKEHKERTVLVRHTT